MIKVKSKKARQHLSVILEDENDTLLSFLRATGKYFGTLEEIKIESKSIEWKMKEWRKRCG